MGNKVILITGIPGAGKTTVADLVAKKIKESVIICGDDLRKMVKNGFVSPAKPWNPETRKQYFLSFNNTASLTENFLKAGFTVIIDDTLHAGDLYFEWAKYLEKYKPLKILLMPSKEVALKRNRERKSHFVDEKVVLQVYENFAKHDYSDWTVIDNGSESVEQTVENIINKL